jgi:hypothetical protein
VTTTLEDRLRDAYQAVGRTVRQETIRPSVQYHRTPPARHTTRIQKRFSMFAPLAAAAAVVVAVGAAVAIPHLVAGSSHHAAVTVPAMNSTPPFLVELTGTSNQLAVQQTGTRHVTELIPAPSHLAWSAVAAAGDTTFIAAVTGTADHTYSSALYRLTLSADGKQSQLTLLRSGIPGGISALAASQDGQRIAYETTPGSARGLATLSVITGAATRHWTAPLMSEPDSTGLMPGSLGFTADGSELGFITFTVADTVGPVSAAGALWLLPVDSASGSATARGHKVTTGPAGSAPFSTALSADGQTMYVLSSPTSVPDSGHPAPQSVTLSAYSTADGALLRTIHTWTNIPASFSTGPAMTVAGGRLLVWSVGGTAAYQIDPVSGAVKEVWVYSLRDKDAATNSSSIAW